MPDDMYDDILEQHRVWLRQQNMMYFSAIPFASPARGWCGAEVEPLSYEELITTSDALWAHGMGVRLD